MLEEVCLGHITDLKEECTNCKIDEYNKNCDRYIPTKTYIVEEEDDKYTS